ncbi:MAG: ribose 5-phosphate isomerase B [Oscillospiraceae bacterium]
MKVAIGCDHGGYRLKKEISAYVRERGCAIEDFGCFNEQSVDYPPIAAKAARAVAENRADLGILICSTGIGISICANKVKGIRAALCTDTHCAEMTRRHNNANILCLGGHVVTVETAKRIVDVFLDTKFEGGRHQKRIDMIKDIEDDIL